MALPTHLAAMTGKDRAGHEDGTLRIVVADLLVMLMDDLGLTQAELARRLGTSPANISRMLSGSQNLTLSTIARIAHALGVRLDPRLVPAPRQGTPAENDPPLPGWVTAPRPASASSPHKRVQYGASDESVLEAAPRTTWSARPKTEGLLDA